MKLYSHTVIATCWKKNWPTLGYSNWQLIFLFFYFIFFWQTGFFNGCRSDFEESDTTWAAKTRLFFVGRYATFMLACLPAVISCEVTWKALKNPLHYSHYCSIQASVVGAHLVASHQRLFILFSFFNVTRKWSEALVCLFSCEISSQQSLLSSLSTLPS